MNFMFEPQKSTTNLNQINFYLISIITPVINTLFTNLQPTIPQVIRRLLAFSEQKRIHCFEILGIRIKITLN